MEDNSRFIHSVQLSILDAKRIINEESEIDYKNNVRKFLKVENLLWEKFDKAEILTKSELEAQINQAYKKIVLGVNL